MPPNELTKIAVVTGAGSGVAPPATVEITYCWAVAAVLKIRNPKMRFVYVIL